jgi:hypothetical protein
MYTSETLGPLVGDVVFVLLGEAMAGTSEQSKSQAIQAW